MRAIEPIELNYNSCIIFFLICRYYICNSVFLYGFINISITIFRILFRVLLVSVCKLHQYCIVGDKISGYMVPVSKILENIEIMAC